MKKILIILLLALPVLAFGQLDTVNIGSSANSGTGESLRSAFLKTNTVMKRLNTLELHNVTSAIQTQLNAKAPLASPAFTGTPTVATTINPDADDGATLGTASVSWSDAFLAQEGVVNWANGDIVLRHGSDYLYLDGGDFSVGENNIELAGQLVITGANLSQTELAALDGVTGADVMTTESLTDAVLINVSDTTVTAVVGKMVFKTSDSHFYGCVATTGKKWKQLDN